MDDVTTKNVQKKPRVKISLSKIVHRFFGAPFTRVARPYPPCRLTRLWAVPSRSAPPVLPFPIAFCRSRSRCATRCSCAPRLAPPDVEREVTRHRCDVHEKPSAIAFLHDLIVFDSDC